MGGRVHLKGGPHAQGGERTRALRGIIRAPRDIIRAPRDIIRDPGHACMGEACMLEGGRAQEPQGA
jgi:hypothetical protein